jgi:hypothetical protein
MTASVRRRTPFRRAVRALGAVALLALLAFAALLLGGAFGDRGEPAATEVHHTAMTAASGHDHAASAVHGLRQQPSTRARSVVFAVLATAVALAAWAFQRLRLARAGHARALRIVGLPPGRAPPALRIV